MDEFNDWIAGLPKAELHLHIDGSLEPGRLLQLASKHGVALPYADEAAVSAACEFENLDEFLAMYYLGASVLRDEEDFYNLMMDYLTKCRTQNILHCEVMVEPQTYADNGVPIEVCMQGFKAAIDDASQAWGQSCLMILSIMRHAPEEDGINTLKAAEPFRDDFVAIGLASSEVPFPPAQFKQLYELAASQGYRLGAHAGEEGPPGYISDALDILSCERIDHGIRCAEDPALVERLAREQIPLTVCPLSNVRLRCFDKMADHNILGLLDRNLCVTVNSDDPAYFGGYLNENFQALHEHLGLNRSQAKKLAANSFRASYLSDAQVARYLQAMEAY